MIGYKLFYG